MSAILSFFTGDWDEDESTEDTRKTGTGGVVKGADIIHTLTSLCNFNNTAIPFCDQVVYGIDGAVMKKEKSFKKHFNGHIGRVYLLDQLQNTNGYQVGWVLDDAYPDCMVCSESFEFLSRGRHHCRSCGILVCDECSKDRASIMQLSNNLKQRWRVCDLCCAQHPPNQIWDLNLKQ
jgi:protein-arginine kinase activator protein McsA